MRILERFSDCELEQVQTVDIWVYKNYLPTILNKAIPVLAKIEIEIENRLFKYSGAAAFYKLRKLRIF